jgi:hypothetical protein
MLLFGALGTLFTVPLLMALKTVSSPFMAFVLITLALASSVSTPRSAAW